MAVVKTQRQALEVWKFGGASLADGEAIGRAAARIAAHKGPLVIVASALGGMTDLLLGAAEHAMAGRIDEADAATETFRSRHLDAARLAMGAPAARVYELSREWAALGHDVTVLTGFPNHPTGVIPPEYRGELIRRETVDGIHVVRTPIYAAANKGLAKRMANYVSFASSASTFGTVLTERPVVKVWLSGEGLPRRVHLVVGLVLPAWVAAWNMWRVHRFTVDDSYISFRYARNLAEGRWSE